MGVWRVGWKGVSGRGKYRERGKLGLIGRSKGAGMGKEERKGEKVRNGKSRIHKGKEGREG